MLCREGRQKTTSETCGSCILPVCYGCYRILCPSDITGPFQALTVSSLLLHCSVLNLAASALLLRSGRRNLESLLDILSFLLFWYAWCLNSRYRPEQEIAERAPSPMVWLGQAVSVSEVCNLVI